MIHRSVTALLQRFNRSDTGLSQTFSVWDTCTWIGNLLELLSVPCLQPSFVPHMEYGNCRNRN